MTDTTTRALQLLGLLQSRPVWNGAELADRLGVTRRSVRRDVDRLRALGYPVEAERGAGGGYRLGAGRALPPLLLDPDEAVAIAVCLRLAATSTVADLGEAALRTMAKLDQLLPTTLRAQASAVHDATLTLAPPAVQISSDLLLTLSRAVRETVRLRLQYVDKYGAATTRDIEPYRIAATPKWWYLIAFDRDRDDWRTFRLDRIDDVHTTTFRFAPRPTPDLETYVRESITEGFREHTATVEIEANIEDVRAQIPATAGKLTASGTGRTRLATGAHSVDALAGWLMMMGFEFRVLDSLELQTALQKYAARATRSAAIGGLGRLA